MSEVVAEHTLNRLNSLMTLYTARRFESDTDKEWKSQIPEKLIGMPPLGGAYICGSGWAKESE